MYLFSIRQTLLCCFVYREIVAKNSYDAGCVQLRY